MDFFIRRQGFPRAFVLFVVALLTACGGGGGGGGGGDDPGNRDGFTLGATSASFSAREEGALPAPQNISITLTGSGAVQLGAAFPAGQVPTWLTVGITGSAPNYTLVLTVNTTHLSPAQRTATVLVGTADSSGNALQSRQLTVNYDLTAIVHVASAPSSATLVVGSSQITQALTVPVTAQNKTWSITSDVPWLQGLPGGNQQGSQTLNLTLNAANLAVNSYTGTLTVQNTADTTDLARVTITLNVLAPTLTVTPNPVVLGGPDGLGNTNKNLLLTLDTGTNTHPYTVVLSDSGGLGWLQGSVPGGTVGSNASNITLDVDRSTGIQPGEHSGSARFDVNVNGTTFSTTVPVALNLESHRLVVENGVALSIFPSRQVLSRTFEVTSSRDRAAVPWSAQSNQGWLTVTQPGSPVVGDNLTLTANPAGLADGQHIALVTLHSTDPTIDRDETIRVGFWVGSADPTDVDVALTSLPFVLVTNPIEPLAYVHIGPDIFVYNVYTGALQNTFTIDGIDGITSQFGAMTISGDGRVLYVFGNQTGVIYGLDAITGAQVSMFRPNPNIIIQGSAANGLSYMRPNGYPLVLTPYGETFDVETGLPINHSGGLESLRSFSRDYRLVYSVNAQISPASSARSTLSYSALHGKVFTITRGTTGADLNGPGADVCLGGTASRVYMLPGGGYVSVRDPTTLANIPPEISHPSGVHIVSLACARNGIVYVGSKFLPVGYDDIQAFDASGASLGMFRAGPDFLELAQIRLSGDETRFASGYGRYNFGQFAIAFRSVPP